MVANGRHRWNILSRAVQRMRELNALEALTSKIPSVLSSVKISLIAWIAASQLVRYPVHNWRQLAASIISCLTTCRTTLATILLEVSSMSIGRTLWFLSRAISQQLIKRCKASGSENDVKVRLATEVKEWQRSEEAVQKDVYKCLHSQSINPWRSNRLLNPNNSTTNKITVQKIKDDRMTAL